VPELDDALRYHLNWWLTEGKDGRPPFRWVMSAEWRTAVMSMTDLRAGAEFEVLR